MAITREYGNTLHTEDLDILKEIGNTIQDEEGNVLYTQVGNTWQGEGGGAGKINEFITSPDVDGVVYVRTGSRPKLIICNFAFTDEPSLNNIMTCLYDEELSTEQSRWVLDPAESNTYYLDLGASEGETGICAIDDTGFYFRSHGENTTNRRVKYIVG